MSTGTTAVLMGTLGATATWLLWTGWRPPVQPLARVLARLGQPSLQPARLSSKDLDARLGAHLRRVDIVEQILERHRSDLRIMGRTADDQAARIGSFALLGLFAGPLVLVPRFLAGVPIPLTIAGWIAVGGAAIGAAYPVLELRDQAAKRRKSFLHALSAYCVAVDMSLQVGAGPEQALNVAAADGEGWQFQQLRAALSSARARNSEPWLALRQLGEEIDVLDLVEVAKTIEQVATRGAAAGETMANIAESIQARIIADIERDATRRTVRMAVPATMLLMGFMVLMIYPAARAVLGTY